MTNADNFFSDMADVVSNMVDAGLKKMSDEEQKEVRSMFSDLDKLQEKSLKFIDEMKAGRTPAEILNISGTSLRAGYTAGCFFYEKKDYVTAGMFFALISFYMPFDENYTYGLALCLDELGKFEEAMAAYIFCTRNNCLEPTYLYKAALCAYHLDQPEVAFKGFQAALITLETRVEEGKIAPYFENLELLCNTMLKVLHESGLKKNRSGKRTKIRRKGV